MSIASHLKVDFAELTSAFGAMTKMGITPSDSGTAINRFLIAMVDNKEKYLIILKNKLFVFVDVKWKKVSVRHSLWEGLVDSHL